MNNLEDKNDLIKVLKNYDVKEYEMQEIAMLTLMLSSGMGVYDILNLKYYDLLVSVTEYFVDTEICPMCFDEVYAHLRYRDDVIGVWEMYNIKRDIPYVTFCTAEAIHAILDYLYMRNEEHFCIHEPLFTGTNGKGITREEIAAIFRQMRNNSGINIRANDVRKLFVKTLKSSEVPEEYIDHLLGHSFDDAITAFLCQNPEFLKAHYMKAAPQFNLNQSGKALDHEDYLYWLNTVKYDDWLID